MNALWFLICVTLVLACVRAVHAEPPSYDLNVAFDVQQSKITGTATIDVPQDTELEIHRGTLHVLSLTTGSCRIVRDNWTSDPFTLHAEGPVQIQFEGTFADPEGDVIDKDKINLREIWYPVAAGTYEFHLTATLPSEFIAVSEADDVHRTDADGLSTYSFDLSHPQRAWDGLTFVASRQWVSRTAKYGDVDLSVHLLPNHAAHLDDTVAQAQRYLRQHEAVLGPYPFKRLTIAENPLPIHYSLSMPTYILLTQESVAEEAAEDSALNHEIAHEWLGNGVLVDYDGGNWAEGLASYFSDHLENERLGRAPQRRQRMMSVYQNNLRDPAASALSDFSESEDRPSRLVGYAKSANVMHMLRRLVGDEPFFASMRRFVADNLFNAASWSDLRRTFEHTTGMDLQWFFSQWIDRTAIPDIGVQEVAVRRIGARHELTFAVTQKAPYFSLAVPFAIYFSGGGRQTDVLQLSGERRSFRYLLDDEPVRVVLDEGYDVFRHVTPAEIPPMFDAALTREGVIVIAPPAEQRKFDKLIAALRRDVPIVLLPRSNARGATFPRVLQRGVTSASRESKGVASSPSATQAGSTSLIFLGTDDPLLAELFGPLKLPRGGFTVTVLKHPRIESDFVTILTATSSAEVEAAYRTLLRWPRYSVAVFDEGKLTHYELLSGKMGIVHEIRAGR